MSSHHPSQGSPDILPAWEDVMQCQALLYDWAESFDTKDFERLKGIVAPTLYLDYRPIMPKGQMWEALPGEQFIAMVSSDGFLGDATLKTQHLIGTTKWIQVDSNYIVSHQQMRVAHQKYKSSDLKEVAFKGHAHGNSKVHYRLIDGAWKFAGLEPGVWWTEYDYHKFFEHQL